MIKYAISGKLKCGKTTLANLLPQKRMSFGDILKKECSETYGIPLRYFYWNKDAVLNVHGTYMTVRKLLQWHGTDYRRAQDHDYWTKKFLQSLPERDIVVDDIRFIDEAQCCKDNGAILIRLEPYEGYSYYSDHKSETELDNYHGFDYVFKPKFGEIPKLLALLDDDKFQAESDVWRLADECN